MKKFILIIVALFFLKGTLNAQVPDFTQTDCNGVTHHLYDDLSAGKAVILNFCAGWCSPCRSSDPKLDTLYRQFGSGTCHVNVYGFIFETNTEGEINTDCKFSQDYATSGNLTYPVFANVGGFSSGLTGSYMSQYNIAGIPVFFVILPNVADPANSQVKIIDGNFPNLIQQFKDSLALGGFVAPAITVNGNLCSGLPFSAQLSSNFASNNTWSTGETSQIITVTSSGNYTLNVGAGCAISQYVQFNQPPVAGTASISATAMCSNGNYTLDYTIPPGATTDVTWEYEYAGDDAWSELGPAGAGPITLQADNAGNSISFRVRANAGACAPAYSNELLISFTAESPGSASGTASASASSFDCQPYTLSYSGSEAGAVWEYFDHSAQYWNIYAPADQGPVVISSAIAPGQENGVQADKWQVVVPTSSCYEVSNPVVIAITTTGSPVISLTCNGGLQVTANPNPGLAAFLWSPGGETTATIGNAKENVDYSVQITDQNGCISTTHQSFQYITVSPNPAIQADTVGPVCSGAPVQLNFVGTLSMPACTGASNGQFPAGAVSVPDNSTTVIATTALEGQYSVVNVGSGKLYDFVSIGLDGFVSTDNVTVTAVDGTTIYATGKGIAEWFAGFTGQVRFYANKIGCVADNSSISKAVVSSSDVSSLSLINWSPGGLTTPAITVNPTSTTTYSLNYTDFFGCESSVSLAVAVATPHTYYVDNDHDGYGSATAVTLCSATAPIGYSTNNTDCNDNDPNVHAIPGISVQPVPVICSGNATLITASSAAANPIYSWYADAAGQNVLQSGAASTYLTPALGANKVYYVSVADGSVSCSTSLATVPVSVSPQPGVSPITYSGSATVCSGTIVTLTDATPGGSWSSSGIAATVSNAGVVTFGTVTATTAITIYYTVTANNCTATVGLPFTVGPPLAISAIAGTLNICAAGGTTALTDATLGGSWSTGNSAIATVASATGVVTAKSTGTVTITYSVSSGGCSASTSVTVSVKAMSAVSPISGNNVLVKGTSIALTDATSGGVWNSSNPAVATVSASGSVKGISAGTCTINYSVTSGSCSATVSKSITVYNPLSASVAAGKILCNSGSATLTVSVTGGSGGYQYSLNGGKFQSSNTFLVPSGVYVIVVKDNMAMQFTISGIHLTQPSSLGLTLTKETNVTVKGAANGSFTVAGSGGIAPYQYSDNAGVSYQGSGTFSNLAAGTYKISIKDANGCVALNKLTVTIAVGSPKKTGIEGSTLAKAGAGEDSLDDPGFQALIAPNPSVSGFNLVLKSDLPEIVEIVVYDLTGRPLYHIRGEATGTYRFGDNFIKGMYFIEIIRKKGIKTLKAIRQ